MKKIILFPRHASNNIWRDLLPKGKLRAVFYQPLTDGTTNRYIFFRLPLLKIPPLYISAAHGGFSDWFALTASGILRDQAIVHLFADSESAIEIQFFGNSNEDNHPGVLSFWYEPEDGDDDSHLAPLSVGRGGETRT